MNTSTPRTYAAKTKSGFAAVPDQFYEFARTLETELSALRAEVERLRSDRDCEKRLRKDADEFRENATERAERAEAELATERARLDWLQAQEVKRGLEITEGHDDPLPFLVLDEDGTTHWGDTYRAAIDAAMKEGAK